MLPQHRNRTQVFLFDFVTGFVCVFVCFVCCLVGWFLVVANCCQDEKLKVHCSHFRSRKSYQPVANECRQHARNSPHYRDTSLVLVRNRFISVRFSSVQSFDRQGRGGDMTDDSAEIPVFMTGFSGKESSTTQTKMEVTALGSSLR